MNHNITIKVKKDEKYIINDIEYIVKETPEGILCKDCGINKLVLDDACPFFCGRTLSLQPVNKVGTYKILYEIECPYCLKNWNMDKNFKVPNTVNCPYCSKTFEVMRKLDNDRY
jgi:DNA-directed RNA polymerase subunit RPC12/RpoP